MTLAAPALDKGHARGRVTTRCSAAGDAAPCLALSGVLERLRTTPCRLNPAVALARALESAERRDVLPAEVVILLQPTIERAAKRGNRDARLARELRAVVRALPSSAARDVPDGF